MYSDVTEYQDCIEYQDLGSIPVLGRSSGEGNGNPLKYSCLENPHEQRSLAGYSPRGPKVLGTAE